MENLDESFILFVRTRIQKPEFRWHKVVELDPLLWPAKPQNEGSQNQKGAAAWEVPPDGLYKINCDASFHQSNGIGKAAFVCRDARGSLIFAGCKEFCCRSAVVAEEAEALREAVRFVEGISWQSIFFEFDALVVISSLASHKDQTPWRILSIVEEIANRSGKIFNVQFRHISRESNKVAHRLSRNVGVLDFRGILYQAPSILSNLLYEDISPSQ
ncbi:conserved hypothetical protein [Ricinus communis]|uniref:RNase H type-1 domain-containing protein n=1 Tax=Ricinus communis TaxID=3988 RepID=B9T1X4_RICCO|nr:conserved hypothetical protein [Ricinus communis]